MKVGGSGPQGSFGMPNDIRDALDKHNQEREAKARLEEGVPPVEEVSVEESPDKTNLVKEVGAIEIFNKLGITFDEKDIQSLIFQGIVVKEIEVIKGTLKAKMKTLTTEEYDAIDTIIAREAKEQDMTLDGMNTRKSTLTLAAGLEEVAGKPFINKKDIPMKGDTPDVEALILLKRKICLSMSGIVVDRLSQTFGAFTLAISEATKNPEDFLKNS